MKVRKSLLSHLCIVLAALFASNYASAASCISADEMSEIAQDFRQFQDLAGKEYCLDDSNRSGILEAVMFMRATVFSKEMKPSEDEIFSGRFSGEWFGYFKERIKEIVIPNNCRKGVGAYVYPFRPVMYVCPMLLSKSFSALDRASVFMHEARHLDGFPHRTCDRGARKGLQGACDNHISDGGSYAVTVETYAQLAKYATDLHPALRAYSRASAITYADETFNSPTSIDRAPQLLLVTDEGQVHLAENLNDLGNLKSVGSVDSGRLLPYASSLILHSDEELLHQWFPNDLGKLEQDPPGTISEINKLPVEERASLLDFHVAGTWKILAFTNRLEISCDPRSNKKIVRELPNGDMPSDFVYLNKYNRGDESVQLRGQSGELYRISCSGRSRANIESVGTAPGNHLKRIFKVGEQIFANSVEGNLVVLEGESELDVPTQLDGQIRDIVPWQSVAFFE